MGIAVYCVGSDAARVARALSVGRRRVSCMRLPASVELVVRCIKEKAPDLVIFGGDAVPAAGVAEALADEPAADGAALIAWGIESGPALSRLTALGAQAVSSSEHALARTCEEIFDAREGRTVRVTDKSDEASQALHGKRVLIADDHPAVAWYFGDTLRRVGCDVDEVHDGWEALDRARRFGPDVVLADIRMPGLDGLRLCRALRADPILSDVPIVMLSWKEDWLARAREADVGATAFLGKHAVPQEIVDCVRVAVARHVSLEARFHEAGPVRGLIGDISAHRLLRLAAAGRASARLTVQAGFRGYEVHVRDGAPVAASRVSPSGEGLRGEGALGELLSLRKGRFVVTADRTKVETELHGTLHQQAAPHVARAREDGPHPSHTPSIPIVIAPTQTIRLPVPSSPSEPFVLIRKPPAEGGSIAHKPRRAVLRTVFKTLLRAAALTALAAIVTGLARDSRRGAPPASPADAPAPPLPVSVSTSAPGIHAARTAPLHPR